MPPNPAFPVAEVDKGLVPHARMEMGGTEIMAADSSGRIKSSSNMFIKITVKGADYVKNAWDLLKEDAHIYMELEPSFFAFLYSSLRNKFGVNWMFSVMK